MCSFLAKSFSLISRHKADLILRASSSPFPWHKANRNRSRISCRCDLSKIVHLDMTLDARVLCLGRHRIVRELHDFLAKDLQCIVSAWPCRSSTMRPEAALYRLSIAIQVQCHTQPSEDGRQGRPKLSRHLSGKQRKVLSLYSSLLSVARLSFHTGPHSQKSARK